MTTLKATVFHFACFSAKQDEKCLEMIKILTSKKGTLYNQFVLQKNSDGLTAVCLAAQRSFQRSVEYLLTLYQCPKVHYTCDIELEYGVRSNNVMILDQIYKKHRNCYQELNTNETPYVCKNKVFYRTYFPHLKQRLQRLEKCLNA